MLLHPAVGEAVGILVELPLHLGVGAVEMLVLQAAGDGPGPALFQVGHRLAYRLVGGVALRGKAHQNHRIRQRNAGLGQPHLQGHVHRGLHYGDDLRVGQAHVLGGTHRKAAAGAGQVACLQQAGQVVQGGVGVAAPHGFLIGREDVIVLVSRAVVAHVAALGHLLYVLQQQLFLPAVLSRRAHGQFQPVQGLAHVAAAALGQLVQGPLFVANLHPALLLQLGGGVFQPLHDVLGGQGLKFKHRAAGEQGAVNVEIGVFGGAGNQGDGAVLDELQ